jgi:hypothetical protein
LAVGVALQMAEQHTLVVWKFDVPLQHQLQLVFVQLPPELNRLPAELSKQFNPHPQLPVQELVQLVPVVVVRPVDVVAVLLFFIRYSSKSAPPPTMTAVEVFIPIPSPKGLNPQSRVR